MKEFKLDLNGKTLSLKVDHIAEQANGSVWAQYGETVVLATVTQSKNLREGIDYFPLSVDYDERFYAVGKILGSRFVRRESRPSDEAILTSRMIDRTLRPLFDKDERHDVQVIITVLSFDQENDPDILSLIASSTAIAISDIPWNGPVGGVRIAKGGDDNLIINPTYKERENSLFDVTVSGKDNTINMIEAGSNEAPESDIEKVFDEGVKFIKQICDFQKNIAKEVGASKMQVIKKEVDKDLEKEVKILAGSKLEEVVFKKDKKELNTELDNLFNVVAGKIKDKFGADKLKDAFNILNKLKDDLIKNNILEKEIRPDGRAIDEIRPISFETGLLPRTHGSGLFTRGMTKSLNIVTLGSPGDEKLIEGMEIQEKKRYMHNYNFPPFSVGEVSPLRGPSRRDIGHGVLAEKALKPVIPSSDVFPYTIRTVSEMLSSNGSTSMASTCSSTLALMDAGVPIKSPVAGISIGLVYENEDNYKLLTDISGIEDGSGHMDFKVAGTEKGITAMQLDVKIEGFPIKVLKEALGRAKKMRLFIIKEMKKVINAPREDLSKFAPRVIILKIDPKKIGIVIGPGGKTINEIIDSTGVKIDIEDDGKVFITSENKESGEEAKKIVENLVKEFKEGDIIKGKVVTIVDFGAFVELSPGRDGLIHVSQMGNKFVKTVHDVLKEGQEVEVKVIGVDPSGKIKLKLLR